MTKRHRWGPWVLMTAAAVAAMLAAVHNSTSNRPSSVEPLVLAHEERGRALEPTEPEPRKQQAPRRMPPITKLERTERAGLEAVLQDRRVMIDAAALTDGSRGPSEAELAAVRGHIVMEDYYTDVESIPRPIADSEWSCEEPLLDRLLAMPSDSAIHPELLPWAAAYAFRHGDGDRGMKLVRRAISEGLVADHVGWHGAIIARERGETLRHGRAHRDLVRPLLILDSAGAPREALAEALRLLLLPEDQALADKRAWLIEGDSLRIQKAISNDVRGAEPRVVTGSVGGDAFAWVRGNALRPVLLSQAEDFLDAWRARDGKRLAAAEVGLVITRARMGATLSAPSSYFGNYRSSFYGAERWQYEADCFGSSRAPRSVGMARFVAAALLFHRDTGSWPADLRELVPGYLPSGALDGASLWGALELGPVATFNRLPREPELAEAVQLFMHSYRRKPDSLAELQAVARPGVDLSRFADRFVTLPARPIFYRCGPADPCSLVVRAELFTPSGGEETTRSDEAAALLRGETQWLTLELVGLERIPPEGLLRLLSGEAKP